MADRVEDELRRALADDVAGIDPRLDLDALHAIARRRARRRTASAGIAACLIAAAVPALYLNRPGDPDRLTATTAAASADPQALGEAALRAVGPGARLAREPESLNPGEITDQQLPPKLLPRRRTAGAVVDVRVPHEGAEWLMSFTAQQLDPQPNGDDAHAFGAWLAQASPDQGEAVDGLPDTHVFPSQSGWTAVQLLPDGSLLTAGIASTTPAENMREALIDVLRELTAS